MTKEEYKGAIEVSVIFHEGQRMFAVPKQPAQQEPTKAAELVDALIAKYSDKLYDSVGPHDAAKFEEDCKHLKQALAEQPAQQEPVAILNHAHGIHTVRSVKLNGLPDGEYNLYTSPPAQRTWVGLEKSDMPDGADPLFDDPKFIAGMVYAANKLMEKNT